MKKSEKAKKSEKKRKKRKNRLEFRFALFRLEAKITMQLHTGAEHFGNVIFQYSQSTSKYHIDA